ncbi:MAG: hypothetical protein KG003_14225 [Bacteroidetes bacterium]|nr:hypothetical protein [Bacteroidota bacterium]MBS3915647.1 hypothetical protein [Bacteroidota bacterium]
MKMWKLTGMAALAILTITGVQSCKKSADANMDAENITSAQDFATSETEFAGAFDISDDINQSDGKIKKGASTILPSGAVFTWIDTSFIDGDGIEYSVDFGPLKTTTPKGLLCGDGKYRAGILHVTVSARYLNIGTVVAVTAADADKYYSGDGVNMFQLQGTMAITRTGAEEITVVIQNGKVTDMNNLTATFQGTKVIKRIAGGSTPGILGDQYEVTGSGSGVNREGDNYTWQITTPLLKRIEAGCARTFVKGIIEIKNISANRSLKVDFDPFGNGACDRTAKAIIGTREIIFTVR